MAQAQTEERLVAPSEAARLLGLSRDTVVRLCESGQLAAQRTPLGRLIDRQAVERLAQVRQAQQSQQAARGA